MPYEVINTLAAEKDLADLYHYVADAESVERAERLLDRLEAAVATLSDHPDRGVRPRELAGMGVTQFRQLVVSPYRIIYQVDQLVVSILIIADGRRDMKALLEKRLLGP